MWAATSSCALSSSEPAGTHMYDVFLSGLGTGDPQVEQKSERNPVSLTYEEMRSAPLTHRKFSAETMSAVFDAEPPCFRHNEQ